MSSEIDAQTDGTDRELGNTPERRWRGCYKAEGRKLFNNVVQLVSDLGRTSSFVPPVETHSNYAKPWNAKNKTYQERPLKRDLNAGSPSASSWWPFVCSQGSTAPHPLHWEKADVLPSSQICSSLGGSLCIPGYFVLKIPALTELLVPTGSWGGYRPLPRLIPILFLLYAPNSPTQGCRKPGPAGVLDKHVLYEAQFKIEYLIP